METEGSSPCERPLLVSIPSQINPSTAPSYFLKIHFNIILSLYLGFPSGFLPSGLPTKPPYAPLLLLGVPHGPPILFFLPWSPE